MIEKEILDKLKDIRGLDIVDDNSLKILILYIFCFVICIASLYLLIKYLRRKNPLDIFEKLDLNNSKEVAYLFSSFDIIKVKDKTKQELYFDIVKRLEVYKYKKSILELDNSLKNDIKRFIA